MRNIIWILIINLSFFANNAFAKNHPLLFDSSYKNFLFIYKKGSIANNDIDDFKKNLNKSFNKKDCKVIFMEYALLTDSVFQKQIIDTIKDRHVDFIIALQNFTEQLVTENGPRQLEAFRFKKMITTKEGIIPLWDIKLAKDLISKYGNVIAIE
ncbi:MAG: hypothetical protein IPJ81_15025 [Chitinophagaceae bacterium]|nr:hypothetical protein [Chitinophagaceae bacterium]